jgi:hypothetical protein
MTGARYTPARVYQPDFWTIGSHNAKNRSRTGVTSPSTSTPWVALLGVFVPIQIDTPCTIVEWWWQNGTLTTAHNVDFGLYREDFTKIQTLGGTVGATTASTIINTTTWTDLAVAPGDYFMAFADDSVRNITTSADALGIYESEGCFEQSGLSAGPTLPATATPVLYNRAFLPNFGMNLYTVAV